MTSANATKAAKPERLGAAKWVPVGGSVNDLRSAAPSCRGCELWDPATQVVFSAGRPDAALVLVGEQPGEQEDLQGKPFVGPAGQLLARAIDEAGIERDAVYLTNAVKHFRFTQSGPGKRRIHEKPAAAHVKACRPWLSAELEAVEGRVVVALGATAAAALFGPSFRLTKQRGELVDADTLDSAGRRMLATWHPSAVLRMREPERTTTYDGLVADLRTAAAAAAAW